MDGQAAKAAEGPERQELLLSIGDDASAWQPPATTEVHTTDTLVEGVHFTLEHTSWRDLGWKALAVNLSDIAAMGCAPHHSLVTLGLRADLPVEGIREMYRGMVEASSRYGGGIAGGDIVRSPTLFVSVTMNGYACRPDGADEGEAPLLRRDRAAPGDLIAVTGHLGSSAGGLRALSGADGASVDDETSAHLRDAHNRPTPRVSEGLALVRAGVAAAMDISDGLVDDLGKMCAASGVGAVVRAERVPTDRSLRRAYPHEYLELALTGGEDYELLFTATRPRDGGGSLSPGHAGDDDRRDRRWAAGGEGLGRGGRAVARGDRRLGPLPAVGGRSRTGSVGRLPHGLEASSRGRSFQHMNILGICGSLRQDSWNLKLLRHATRAVSERGAETDIFDLNTVPMFHPDRQNEGFAAGAQALHEAIQAADAVMVACPEYNGSMTGALKNALEWASRRGNVLDGKVFFVMGTGPGRSGCVRMHMHATSSLQSRGRHRRPPTPGAASHRHRLHGARRHDHGPVDTPIARRGSGAGHLDRRPSGRLRLVRKGGPA